MLLSCDLSTVFIRIYGYAYGKQLLGGQTAVGLNPITPVKQYKDSVQQRFYNKVSRGYREWFFVQTILMQMQTENSKIKLPQYQANDYSIQTLTME